jgi:hypothetical protein
MLCIQITFVLSHDFSGLDVYSSKFIGGVCIKHLVIIGSDAYSFYGLIADFYVKDWSAGSFDIVHSNLLKQMMSDWK